MGIECTIRYVQDLFIILVYGCYLVEGGNVQMMFVLGGLYPADV